MKKGKYNPTPGVLAPKVNLSKCEGKGPCIEVCPYHVFEMKPITHKEYSQLNFVGKIKTIVHGRNKAFVVHPHLCHSCGLCVISCSEKAIKLEKLKIK